MRPILAGWQHDLFTLLADAALHRPLRHWRFSNPDGYRLRFLRQIALAAGLLEPSSMTITALALDWLAQPTLEQQAILLEAWRDAADSGVRGALITQLEAWPLHITFTPAELTARSSPRQQQRLWQPLVWLGVLNLATGQPVLLTRAPAPQPLGPAAPWRITESEIVAEPPFDWARLLELEKIALLTALEPARRYRLERSHWLHAAALGQTPASALALLEGASGEPLPAGVWKWFAQPTPDVTLTPGVLVTFTHAEDLNKLLKRPAWRARLAHRLTPQHALVSLPQAPLIRNALIHRKLRVHGQPPAPQNPAPKSPRNTDRMHFLLAARVMQELARELELPAPLDQTTLRAMAAHLPASQQRRLERAVRGQLEQIRARLPDPRAPATELPAEGIINTLQAAASQAGSLQVLYQPPSPRPPITRVVVALRLETWGRHTYLLAHCLQRDEVRTFRVDRILSAVSLPQGNAEPGASTQI